MTLKAERLEVGRLKGPEAAPGFSFQPSSLRSKVPNRLRMERLSPPTVYRYPTMPEPLYVRIAENVSHQVATGALRPGDRVPSLRELSRQLDVSVSTALQAYLLLEN